MSGKKTQKEKIFQRWYDTLSCGQEGIFRFILRQSFDKGYESGRLDTIEQLEAYKLECARLNKEIDEISEQIQAAGLYGPIQ